jgi:flagella basal body P-ring formation protein FlgA
VTLPASALPAPQAARLRRPSWRDTRLLVGVVLVLASIAIGARVIAAADDTVPVYAARITLPAGTTLRGDVLSVVQVRLGASATRYFDAGAVPPAGEVLLRPVAAGELVPRSAVGQASALRRRPVGIPLDGAVPAGLAPGGLVDVWASARQSQAGVANYGPPRRLASSAEVYQVISPEGALAGTATTVQVLLGEQELAAVLDAIANGARTVVVPVPGTAPAVRGG